MAHLRHADGRLECLLVGGRPGQVNRHFRQLIIEIFEPSRPHRRSKIASTQQIPYLVNINI